MDSGQNYSENWQNFGICHVTSLVPLRFSLPNSCSNACSPCPTSTPHFSTSGHTWTPLLHGRHLLTIFQHISTYWPKKHALDELVIATDRFTILTNLTINHSKARLLAIMDLHSGDCLHALSVTSCGTRFAVEVIWLVIGLHLSISYANMIHACVEFK